MTETPGRYDIGESSDVLKMNKKARMTVSLEPEAYEKLTKRAKRQGRTPANLAAFLLTLAIEMDLEPKDEEEEARGKTVSSGAST